MVVSDSSSFIPANRCARDGQESGPFASRARYASQRSTTLMRRKVGVLDELSADLRSDNQRYCAASSANVAHAQNYDTRPIMDDIGPNSDENQ